MLFRSLIGELRNEEVREYVFNPAQLGMPVSSLSEIQVSDSSGSRDMMLAALSNQPGPARDILVLNAGAAIYVAGLADSHQAGVQKAVEVLASGAAKAKLDQFVAFTQKLKNY